MAHMENAFLMPENDISPAEQRQRLWLAERVSDTLALIKMQHEFTSRPSPITAAQMLKASFGTESPAGIHVETAPSHEMVVGECHFPKAKGCYGWGTNRITLRKDFLEAANDNAGAYTTHHMMATSVTAHETMHYLQYMNIERLADLSDKTSYEIQDKYKQPLFKTFNLQATPETQERQKKALAKVNNTTPFDSPARYLSKPIEIQARLHQLATFGYSHWQKLPANRTEFYAAFTGLGLSAPKEIRAMLETTTEGQKALKDFETPPFYPAEIKQFIDHIDILYHFAADEKKQSHLWEQTLPALYGEMLEIYGDPGGKALMGFSDKEPGISPDCLTL